MGKICTIGYEGRNCDEFIELLRKEKISLLIDIRENTNSRKKGFSKKALAESLRNKGIEYKHLAELGTPKHIRLAYKNSGNIEDLLNGYTNYLNENPEYINNLLEEIGDKDACLMCFERLPINCHRFVIAEYLYQQGVEVKHL